MSNFPLYRNLSAKIPKKPLSSKQKTEFVESINRMDKDGVELVVALIRAHQIDHRPVMGTPLAVPYEGCFDGSELTFDMDCLPTDLCHILFKFSKVHSKDVQESALRRAVAAKVVANSCTK